MGEETDYGDALAELQTPEEVAEFIGGGGRFVRHPRELLLAARDRYPDDPAVLDAVAQRLAALGDRDEALGAAERALELAPDDLRMRLGKARILSEQRRWGEAEGTLRGAPPDAASTEEYRRELAEVLVMQGRFGEAVDALETPATATAFIAAELRPEALLVAAREHFSGDAAVLAAVAGGFEALSQLPAALETYGRAHEVAPDDLAIRAELVNVLLQLQRSEEARRLVQDTPSSAGAGDAWRTARAEVAVALGNVEAALDELETADAVAAFLPGDGERPVALLAAARERYADTPAVLRAVAEVYEQRAEHGDAVEAYMRALELESGDLMLRLRTAWNLRLAGRPAEAEQLIRAAPPEAAAELAWQRELAEALVAQGRHDEALTVLGDAAAVAVFIFSGFQRPEALLAAARGRYPGDVQVLEGVGIAYAGLDLPAAAVDALERAIELEPSLSDARLSLARVLRELGRTAEAVATLRAAPPAVAAGRDLKLELADALIAEGRVDDALATLDTAAAVVAYLDNPILAAPEALLDAVLRRHSGDVAVLAAVGSSYLRLDRAAPAAEVLTRALDAAPADPRLRTDLAGALRRLGRTTDAERIVRAAPAAAAFDGGLRYELVELLLAQERLGEAVSAAAANGSLEQIRYEVTNARFEGDRQALVRGMALSAAVRDAAAQVPSGADAAWAALGEEAGWLYFMRKRAVAALDLFRFALAAGAGSTALAGASMSLRELGKVDEATAMVDAGLVTAPNDGSLLIERALCDLAHNRIDSALEWMDKAFEAEPENPFMTTSRLAALRIARRIPEAAAEARSAQARFPDDPWVLSEIAAIAVEQREYTVAAAAYARSADAQATTSDRGSADFNRGVGLVASRHFDTARAAYREAAKTSPDEIAVAALVNEGDLLWTHGAYGAARKAWREGQTMLERLVGEGFTWLEVYSVTAHVLRQSEADDVQAEQLLNRALELDGDRVDIQIGLIELYRQRELRRDDAPPEASDAPEDREPLSDADLGAFSRMRELHGRCERALQRQLAHGRRPDLLISLGRLAAAMGHDEDAERAFREAADAEPTRAEPWIRRGVLASRTGRHRGAVRCFEEALRREPEDLEARVNLAEAFRRSGALDDAELNYKRVLRRAPGNVEAHIGLGELHVEIGDRDEDPDAYEEAERRFTRALDLGRGDTGSKALQRDGRASDPVQVANILYLRGYARVRRHEALGLFGDTHGLDAALADFRACRDVNPAHSKAQRAIAKIKTRTSRATQHWFEERFAPVFVAVLAGVVFALSQLSFYSNWPVETLAATAYISLTFSALLFVVAGLALPRLLKLKVGGLELEKTSASQVTNPTTLGITR